MSSEMRGKVEMWRDDIRKLCRYEGHRCDFRSLLEGIEQSMSALLARTEADSIRDDNLPGMWERADLIGGATDAEEEARERMGWGAVVESPRTEAGAEKWANAGDSEAQFIADGENLNCPTCGGSGHVDDAAQVGDAAAHIHDYGDRVRVVWDKPWADFPVGTRFFTNPQDASGDAECRTYAETRAYGRGYAAGKKAAMQAKEGA